jgi:lactate dehydrogenase-like 2-hydroxyacid dehydrogenase
VFFLNLNVGYAKDVLNGHLNIKNYPLINYASTNDNVIITAHIGGNIFKSIKKNGEFYCP